MARISKHAATTDGTAIRRNPVMFLLGASVSDRTLIDKPPPAGSGQLRYFKGTWLRAGAAARAAPEPERATVSSGHRVGSAQFAGGCSVKTWRPVKISSFMMNANARRYRAAIGAMMHQTFHRSPAACLSLIHRRTGGSRRMTSGMLIATIW